MMKKLALAVLFILQLSILPSWGADTVLIDRITSSEAEELNIDIPASVVPGFHEVVIEISDGAGVVESKVLTFCKDLDGRIDWESKCPDLVKTFSQEELSKITDRGNLPSYNPIQDVDKTKDLQVTAFAALAALSAAGGAASAAGGGASTSGTAGRREGEGNTEDDTDDGSEESQDELASVSAGDLLLIQRKPGRGDLSRTWTAVGGARVEALFSKVAERVSSKSPLLARTIADASYLRAIFGSLSLVSVIPAVILGLAAIQSTQAQALPPTLWIVFAIIALAILDAFSGLIAGAIFISGVLVTGHISSRDELLTMAGLFILFYAPALIASAVRPLRRIAENRDDMWERTTDYALITLLTGWSISKMIGALNGLAGIQLAITFHATDIGYWTAVFVLARLLLEDFATYAYPQRLKAVSTDFREVSTLQKVISLELKTFIFVELAMPFVGFNIKLLLGTLIFLAPSVIGIIFDGKFPKSVLLHRVLPSGAFKIVAMVFIGTVTTAWIQGLFTSPAKFLEWSFVVLAIPGLILGLLGKMAKKPERDWKSSNSGNTFYRLLGIVVFIAIVQIVRGVDLYAAFFG
jgi:hypothetical protein